MCFSGTVILSANVAFLAIQSVDSQNSSRSPAQIASYISFVTSAGGVILGLLLLRQHMKINGDATTPEMVVSQLLPCALYIHITFVGTFSEQGR